MPPQKRLLDQVRDLLRVKHYSLRTEQAYVNWIQRFILLHDKRHPREMGMTEISAFLTHLAVEDHVAASTQNQALAALLFLYHELLQVNLTEPLNALRAQKPERLPTVLTKTEVQNVLRQMSCAHLLIAQLQYGGGLRLLEGLRLRVKDLDFERCEILVREGKGDSDRVTTLPISLVEPLRSQLLQVQQWHAQDLARGYGCVYLPDALERKYP